MNIASEVPVASEMDVSSEMEVAPRTPARQVSNLEALGIRSGEQLLRSLLDIPCKCCSAIAHMCCTLRGSSVFRQGSRGQECQAKQQTHHNGHAGFSCF